MWSDALEENHFNSIFKEMEQNIPKIHVDPQKTLKSQRNHERAEQKDVTIPDFEMY